MQAATFEQSSQRLARRQQVRLTNEFIEARRPHAIGERPERGRAYLSHDSTRCAQPPVSSKASTNPAAMPAVLAAMS